MPREYIKITGAPEMRKGKKEWTFRFRIPAHHGIEAGWSKWQKTGTKKKSEASRIAEAWREQTEEEINDWSARSDLTLGEYAEAWHEDRTEEQNKLSYRREGQIIELIQQSELGQIPIANIEPDDIEKQKKANDKAGWSKDKQRRYLQKVKQITKEASGKRKIKHDPGAPVKEIKTKKKEREAVPAIVIADMLEVLDQVEKDGKTAALRIAIGTAYRRGELLGLQWGDIDLLHKKINLQRQLNRDGELVDPKYDSKGVININDELAAWLEEWRQIYTQKHGTPRRTAPVCCNESGDYLVPSNFDRWRRLFFVQHKWGTFEKVEKVRDASGDTRYHRTGFRGYTLHGIRHYVATELIGSGTDIRSTQAVMRHKRITTTEGYVHEIPDNVRIAMKNLGRRQEIVKGALRYAEETSGEWYDEDELEAQAKAWEEQQSKKESA